MRFVLLAICSICYSCAVSPEAVIASAEAGDEGDVQDEGDAQDKKAPSLKFYRVKVVKPGSRGLKVNFKLALDDHSLETCVIPQGIMCIDTGSSPIAGKEVSLILKNYQSDYNFSSNGRKGFTANSTLSSVYDYATGTYHKGEPISIELSCKVSQDGTLEISKIDLHAFDLGEVYTYRAGSSGHGSFEDLKETDFKCKHFPKASYHGEGSTL